MVLLHMGDCPCGGLGQKPESTGHTVLCAVQRVMLCTQLISKTLRENYFSQTSLAIRITAKCSRLKIQLSSLQSFPMALGHQSPKRKLDMILPIGFSAERTFSFFYMYINNLVLKMHLLAKIAVK